MTKAQLSSIDTIVFDKTGTLTQEMPQVSQILSCDAFSQGTRKDLIMKKGYHENG